ncbi:hypothetical protein [Haloarchaeobius sp. TZWSO28]
MPDLRAHSESLVSEDITIGYIGGGSEGWAHTLINDLGQWMVREDAPGD